MSSSDCGLLSATFYEPGYDHVVELVHQRDPAAQRRLRSVTLTFYAETGEALAERAVDTAEETFDLAAEAAPLVGARPRVMAALDARYDARVFPYRPHHYAYLHRRGSASPPLYYAVSAALGGVPDRIDATRLNNFETYLFRPAPPQQRYAVVLGNLARLADAEVQITAHYGEASARQTVALAPRAHVEIALEGARDGQALARVEVKAPFRLASYVIGRRTGSGELTLFDHLFTYFK